MSADLDPAPRTVVNTVMGGQHVAVTDQGPSAARLEPDHPGILVGRGDGPTADPVILSIFLAALTILK